MKNIKDLTEQDCIHCRTKEQFKAILELMPNANNLDEEKWNESGVNSYLRLCEISGNSAFGSLQYAHDNGYTIHPASDFLTPQVSVLTEIGDCKVIKNGGDVIVMTGNVVITLTPPVLKHIQELMKSIGL